ncbi:hypothetical protein KIN20_019642 [Parelaphostrongylus tenuis]|uniref:Uncharacterized protein n=1 Tax=Parelaphostrongylus tenuis TaxID=148309 RepID=A0AAD5N525_PARTN|nr:hypothetical protein KIN20_019642 [Parelaphostrongylus tenuis]
MLQITLLTLCGTIFSSKRASTERQVRRSKRPMAANMLLMNYDCDAEIHAYKHVKTCDKKPSSPKERPESSYLLENIHILETNETSLSDSFIAQSVSCGDDIELPDKM